MTNISRPTAYDLNKTFSTFLKDKKVNNYAPIPNQKLKDDSTQLTINDIKTFNVKKFALTSIGMTVLGIATFGLMGTSTTGLQRLIKRTTNKLNSEIAKLSDSNKVAEHAHSFTLDAYKQTVKFLEKLNGLANFTPAKDQAADRLFRQIGIKKYADDITSWFRKVAKSTTVDKYSKAFHDTQEFRRYILNIAEDINDNSSLKLEIDDKVMNNKEIASEIKRLADKVDIELQNLIRGFDNSVDGSESRYQQMLNLMEKHVKTGWESELSGIKNKKGFWAKFSTFTDLIPEKVIRTFKQDFIKPTMGAKSKITNSPRDVGDNLLSILDDAIFLIKSDNKEARSSYTRLTKLISEFKDPEIQEGKKILTRPELKQALIEEFSLLSKSIEGSSDKVKNLVDSCSKVIGEDSLGCIQEISRLCKAIEQVDPKKYAKLENLREESQRSISSAVKSETDNLFDKLRDLELGAAPTDVIGLVTPVTLAGVAVGAADNKDEKISVGLKAGLPAVAAVGTCIIATLRQFSGAKAIGFAAATGFVFNKIGSWINDKYLEFNNKQKTKPNKIYA